MKTWEAVKRRSDGRHGRVTDIDWASQMAQVLWDDDAYNDPEWVGFADLTTKEET